MTPAPTAPAAWYDRSGRVRLEILGPDRAKFLHNLTTNDVKRLAEGAGHESFITSPQGKTLAYITVLATADALLLRTDSPPESFLPHLGKYGVFDDVAIEDRSAETFEYHVAGPAADDAVAEAGFPIDGLTKPLAHRAIGRDGATIRVVREAPLGVPGWTLIGPTEAAATVAACLAGAIGAAAPAADYAVRRIEAGMPASGVDVLPTHLPQEVGRDAEAINFVKGCYLGQETVARLDALGHVNKILRAGRVEGTVEVPPPGTALVGEDGKPAGTITSAAFSPSQGAPVFLAYVRVAHAEAGSRLAIPALAGAGGRPAVAVIIDPARRA